jgi:hypothetical protein
VGSLVRRTTTEQGGHARGPLMEEWYDSSWSRLRLRSIGRCSSGGRQTRLWPAASSVRRQGGGGPLDWLRNKENEAEEWHAVAWLEG